MSHDPTGRDDGRDHADDARAQVARLVGLLVAVLRWSAREAGVPETQIEAEVASTLAYARRAVTGESAVDEFGFDPDFTEHVYLPILRPLYRRWFRTQVHGAENLPRDGGALVVANHSGTIAIDSVMTQVAVHEHTPDHRFLRLLGADLVFATPFLGQVARRAGTTLASRGDAHRLLEAGELVGVWPEGFKGVGKPFSERYRLQRFGRGGFVAAALRTGSPVVPCSIVGAEESYPMIADLAPVAQALGLPYFPLTPTFPHLGLLGLVPLPTRWIIDFGEPLDTTGLGPDDADDPLVVFDLTDRVREHIQTRLHRLLSERGHPFT
ncbi:lysophospholipid acyltransferase family protein [Agilicoccus flavus]|uniref:lysophospholipid acyltransferase family protein n=1 Tax=Agilicoccus flavus TaxID=2775968 RepID=UPI001CF712E4|nr:lysophospholipid acyltransferase family protein [Agilicoccus flavus]